jgi:hypothetical protein
MMLQNEPLAGLDYPKVIHNLVDSFWISVDKECQLIYA